MLLCVSGAVFSKEVGAVAQGYDEYGRQSVDKTVVARIPVVRTRRAAREERTAAEAAARSWTAGPGDTAPQRRASVRQPAAGAYYPEDAPADVAGTYRPAAASAAPSPEPRGGVVSAPAPERRGASALRWLIRIILLGCLVFGLLTIRYLTEQTVDQTSALSGTAQDYTELGAYLVQSGQTPSAEADPVKWTAERILWVSYKLSSKGLDIRHQAHVVEFGLLGGIAALNVLAWMSGWAHRRDAYGRIRSARTALMVLLTLGISMAASLADQYHKLSVPGRHFDKWDLLLDATGYVGALVVVFTVWGIGSAIYRLVARK